ncbi:MAG: helix-turn-helix domain-containing protein [Anaerolineales bacterium]
MKNEASPHLLTAERILALRRHRGWTQAELADKTGLERKSIIRYETGQNAPGGKAIAALSSVFEVSADYLLGLSHHPKPIPAGDSDLSPIELEAVQALRRARTEEQRRRLLDALNALVPMDSA